MQSVQPQTETGIDLSNYTDEKAAGVARIAKLVPGTKNYLYAKSSFTTQIVDGRPALVEGAPTYQNINRGSLATIREQVAVARARLDMVEAQCAAIEADMDALDAAEAPAAA